MDRHPQTEKNSSESISQTSIAEAGVEHLFDKTPPHESYESLHRYDPQASWTEAEESKLLWKTDLYLLSWVCLMVKCRGGWGRPGH